MLTAANNTIAPIMYGNIVFLYSAFSSALPIMYLIPITINTPTAINVPTIWIIPKILFPIVQKFPVFSPGVGETLSNKFVAKTGLIAVLSLI